MQRATLQTIKLDERGIDYRLVLSKSAKKLRVRVGIDGVEVIQPSGRNINEVEIFLKSNQKWIMNQLDRVERLRLVRKPILRNESEILLRGITTPVRVEDVTQRRTTNKVVFENGSLTVVRGSRSCTPPARSLENWLRKRARKEIMRHVAVLTAKLGKYPRKIYVMGQRTKWGNCSPLQNLSFNWRLIMAPDFVLQYLVTHEVVHLEVPDHSKRFWLTVQSLCPEMDRARQWLAANSDRLMVKVHQIL